MAWTIQRVPRVLWLALCIAPGLVEGLKLAINPDPTDPPLVPGNTIHVRSTAEQGDPSKVNLYIYDTVRKNSTELWEGLEPANSVHSLFEIPPLPPGKQYVVRATRTSGEFLADSPAFEILAGTHTTSGSSVSSTSSGASRSTASTVSSSSSNTSTPPGLGRAKQSPVGAIVGGVLGGLALIAIILGLLLCLRHRREGKSSTSGDLEKSRLETRNSRLEPFTAIQPQASSSASTSTKRPLASNSPVTALVSTAGDSTDFISMSSPLLSSALPPSSPPVSDSVSSRAAAQAELRQQKRQLKQQIALAENGSPVSSPSANGSSPRSDDADVRQQLDDLRAQIRQLELRQAQASAPAWQENTPEEPPPDYNR